MEIDWWTFGALMFEMLTGDPPFTAGSIKELHTGTYQDCCTACAHNGDCLAWDWNSAGGTCYLKDNAKGTAHAQRWSGKMPKKLEDGALAVPASPAPPHGPPAGHPPQSLTKYDDSTWQLVDAPHDMLINQEFVRAAAALFLAFFFASLKRSRCAERRKHEGNGVPPAQLGLVS